MPLVDGHPGVALVTGGARGIGRAIVDRLDGEGWTVVVGDIDPTDDDHVPLDVRERASCERAARLVLERHGRLDALVNNAGVNHRASPEDITAADWERVLDVNLNGTFRMCQVAFDALSGSPHGAIVNLGSTCGSKAVIGSVGYCVSKAAIMHLTRVLALEWAAAGIRVNAVAPTIVPTAMTDDVRGDDEYLAGKLATIPLGRMVEPAEVAAAVGFLASTAAAMVTGQVLHVDGGVTA